MFLTWRQLVGVRDQEESDSVGERFAAKQRLHLLDLHIALWISALTCDTGECAVKPEPPHLVKPLFYPRLLITVEKLLHGWLTVAGIDMGQRYREKGVALWCDKPSAPAQFLQMEPAGAFSLQLVCAAVRIK